MKRVLLSLLTVLVVVVPATFAQWQQVLTGFPYAHHRIMAIDVVNQDVIWAATDSTINNSFSSRVLRSTDGGQSWTTNFIPGSQTQFILDIDAVDANTAWVATNEFNGGGSMYKTTNGGSTWTLQRNGSFVFVHFFDAQNGVSVNQAIVLTTSDGGATWTGVPNVPPYDNNEYNIVSSGSNTHAQSGDTIWIPTSKGRVYRSTNRGYIWTASQTALGRNACITSVGFKDGRNGLAISCADSNNIITPNRLARTNDGGTTWTEITAPSSPTGNSLAYVPGTPGTYLLVGGGYGGDVPGCTYTTDSGTTWTAIDTNPYNALMFLSPTIGWAGAFTTNDGMYKWTGNLLVPPQASTQWQLQTTIDGNPPLYSIHTVSDRVAWIGSFDTLYRTTNGGANWTPTPASPTSTETIVCVEGLSATTAFVGGGGPGSGGGNAKIYRTTNGGQNWSVVYTAAGTASYWNAIHFFDAQNGIAHSDPPNPGNAFLIVKTTDGGTTWTPIANPPSANAGEYGIQNMYFYDALHGWFGTGRVDTTANAGRVFRTTDGGNNWIGYASGNTDIVPGVQFVSPLVGIRISYSAPFVTRSTDGGQTWTPVSNLPIANILNMSSVTGVHTSSGSQLWTDGFTQTDGPFMITSVDGGATWQEQALPTLPASHIPFLSAVSFGALNDSVRAFGATIDVATGGGGQVLSYRERVGYVTGVDEATSLPTEYALSQNYPNPFNPSTNITFNVPGSKVVSLKVYDILGREVATLVNEEKQSGIHRAEWNAGGAASGVYFYRLQAGSFVETKKMLLLR